MKSPCQENNSFNRKLSSNIWKLYLYRVFSCMLFVTPVFVLFLQENGLTLTQVMLLQAYFTVVVLLLEIPTGIFADRYGRKKAIFYSTLFMVLGIAFYGWGRSIGIFFVAETFWALAASLWSGTDAAFIYDTLKGLKRQNEYKKIFGTFSALNAVMLGIASIIGGLIAKYSLRLTYQLSIIPVIIAIVIVLTFKEPPIYKKVSPTYSGHLREAFQTISRSSKLRSIILITSVFHMAYMIVYYLFQPYLISLDIPLSYLGFIYLAIMLCSAIGNKTAHYIDTALGEKLSLTTILLFAGAGYLFLSASSKFFVIVPIMIIAYAGGALLPIVSDIMNKLVQSHHRATIISINSFAQNLLFSIAAPAIGFISSRSSISRVILIAGMLMIGNLFILSLLWKKNERKV